MKTKLLLFLICLSAPLAFSQGIRVGDSLPLQTTAVIQGTTVIVPVGIASIQMCNAPANATPCTNKATTYTDRTLGTPCSTATQVVLAGTTTCVTNSDSIGNWGVWLASGNYEWTFTNSAGASFGPYPVTAQSSPNVNAWSSLAVPTTNLTLAMGNNTTAFSWASPPATSKVFSLLAAGTGLTVEGSGELVMGDVSGSSVSGALDVSMNTGVQVPTPTTFHLICFGSNPGFPTLCGTSQTTGALLGICTAICNGNNGNPPIARYGIASCAFDGATTAGHWVIVSTTIAGDCHDSGTASVPATTLSTVGQVLTTGAAANYPVLLQIAR